MVFIGLDKLLVIFRLVGDGIGDSCGKVGYHMNTFLILCALLHGNGVNFGCGEIRGVFGEKLLECFWGSGLLLVINEDVLYASLGGLLARLVLESSEMVCW